MAQEKVLKQPLGFFLIDKPKHITSFFVVKTLRKVLQMKRIGYAGTLDPLATGLMIVAVGEATKLLFDLEHSDKIYDVVITLGAVSETYDAEGPIHETVIPADQEEGAQNRFEKISREQIEKIIQENFSGERMQVPPRYSAIKIGGKHAYDLVRKGKEVVLNAKKVNFLDVQVRSFQYPMLECSVHCSAGTYIRSFAHDLGQILGCGAYVQELKRVEIGPHSLEDAVALNTLVPENYERFLQSPEKFLADWQRCDLTEKEYAFLKHGGFVANRWQFDRNQILGMFEGKTVGLLELCEENRSIKFAKKFILG